MVASVAADFVPTVLQELHLVPGIRREPVFAEEAVMIELVAGRDVLGRNEVSDGDAGCLGDGPQIDEVIRVAIVESQSHGRHRDRTFSNKTDRLAQAHHAVVPEEVVHLPQKIRGCNPEAVRTIRNKVVVKDHHRKVGCATVAPIAQRDRNRKQERLRQQLPGRPSVRIAVAFSTSRELLLHPEEVFGYRRTQRLARSGLGVSFTLPRAKSRIAATIRSHPTTSAFKARLSRSSKGSMGIVAERITPPTSTLASTR